MTRGKKGRLPSRASKKKTTTCKSRRCVCERAGHLDLGMNPEFQWIACAYVTAILASCFAGNLVSDTINHFLPNSFMLRCLLNTVSASLFVVVSVAATTHVETLREVEKFQHYREQHPGPETNKLHSLTPAHAASQWLGHTVNIVRRLNHHLKQPSSPTISSV